MSEFRITGPGEYRMRNGKKAHVQRDAERPRLWRNTSVANPMYHENGGLVHGAYHQTSFDIVGPWIEPFAITEPGDYVTRDGRKAVVLTVNNPSLRAPVLGYIIMDGGSGCGLWDTGGLLVAAVGSEARRPQGDRLPYQGDIVGKWVIPVSWEAWFPISSDGEIGRPFETKQDADRYRSDKQCVRRLRFDGTKIVDVTDEVVS